MSSISEPPKKKQRLCDVESLEMKNQHKSYKISLKIHTKLGDSEKIFEINNLQKIAYFASQLSGRWCTDNNILNINCDSLYFGVDEVESLIFFKKHGKIHVEYPYNRLIYLCNALNYFTEIIQSNTFETYFSECIPAIQYQNLIQLKSLCHQEECDILSAAIDQITRQISIRQKTINNKIIESWKLVPIKLITSNFAIATAVFTTNFVFSSKSRFNTDPSVLEFAQARDANDLKILWDYIMFNKLYLRNPAIIEVVYQLKLRSSSSYRDINIRHVDNKTSLVISQIVTDTLQICLENNLKYKSEATYTMITNIFNIMNTESNGFEKKTDIPDRVKVAKQIFFNYDFLFNILKKLVDLNRMNGEKFKTHFGNDLIVQLWTEKLRNIAPIAKYREIMKDFEELKITETFTKTEQYQLFKTLLCCGYNCLELNEETLKEILLALIAIVKQLPTDQYQYQLLETILNDKREIERIVTKDFLKNVLKCLIEIDYTQSFKLTHVWFPVFMNTDKNWIIKELPAQTSLKTLSTLIEGICEYITRNEGAANSFMDSCYFEFINKYTNVWDSV